MLQGGEESSVYLSLTTILYRFMKIDHASLLADIPQYLPEELCQTLLNYPEFRLERIVSRGHHSASDFWYDQDEDEWVLVLQGRAELGFADGSCVVMTAGDYLLIPARCQHRVNWTSNTEDTVWLAIFFNASAVQI